MLDRKKYQSFLSVHLIYASVVMVALAFYPLQAMEDEDAPFLDFTAMFSGFLKTCSSF